MSRKKVTPISLYLKELRRNENGKVYDMKTAGVLFKLLSIRDKDYYEVAAKRINEKNASEAVLTTQRDTLGNNLKEVNEKAYRKIEWDKNCQSHISSMVSDRNILQKEFFVAKIAGVDFNRCDTNESCFATSEICFIKFSFTKGIIDKLILFPDIVNVAAGYRQHLYEDLEENVGWKPETFRNNHSIDETIIEIRKFFNGNYEPIFVPTKDHVEEVGLGLLTLYNERKLSCPWLESYDDWGKRCKIYQLEYLISSMFNRNSDTSNEDLSVSVILDAWRKLKVEIAPETCERHMQYGLANQCATNILIKYLYGSFLILHSPEMPDIRSLVSDNFYQDMDFIMPLEASEEPDVESVAPVSNVMWSNYFFDKSGIEDVITSMSGITIRNDNDSVSNYKKQVEWGRGRGLARRQGNNCNTPGTTVAQRKLKLPNVIC